ncbi:MAG: type transport system ATP-binding protein [Candidatus Sumerlaeota bacterium]|nr:type transport system ATP-binding protein [Candidatus Sumerlaeota bacterium]
MPALEIEGVTKVYPNLRKALDGVSFSCHEGVFGLLGPNGAGKSTLMRILAGSLDFESGRVSLDGQHDVRRHPAEWRRRLGFMPQSFDFVPHLTALEYLDQCALLGGFAPRALRPRMMELLERVNLTDAAHRRGADFSRGMKQRLAAAAAFLCDPLLVLLDEPTAGLDPRERILFRELVTDLSRGRVVLLSTHIVPDVERCCEQVAVIREGRLLFHGRAEQLARRAEGNVWECAVDEQTAAALEQERRLVRLRPSGGAAIARAVGEVSPLPEAKPVEPTLEDGYVLLVNAAATPPEALSP